MWQLNMAMQDIYLFVHLMMVAYESLAPDMWNFVWNYIMSVPVHTIDSIFYISTIANTVSGWGVCLYVEEITDLGSLQWNLELRNIHCGWHCVIVLYFKNISFVVWAWPRSFRYVQFTLQQATEIDAFGGLQYCLHYSCWSCKNVELGCGELYS